MGTLLAKNADVVWTGSGANCAMPAMLAALNG